MEEDDTNQSGRSTTIVGEHERNINDWLSITKSRNARWWYSSFHNVTAVVGAGVLGFPYAMSELGWGPGVTILILSWICTLYTAWQMIEMHEPEQGKRLDRYHELGQYAFGEKLGLWIVVPQQLMVQVGVNIVYMITGGNSLKKIYDTICVDGCTPIRRTYFIMMFAAIQFVLSHLPSLNSIAAVSFVAAVMSISYSTMAWITTAHRGVQPGVEYGSRFSTDAENVFGFFSALGTIAFGYSGHNVVLEIQATIPSTPENPSKKAMWKGMVVAYIVVALCYFPVACIGYWAFGNAVDDSILLSLEKPRWVIIAANIFVFVHVTGSYQIFAVPVFDTLESFLVKEMKFQPTWFLRFITRNSYGHGPLLRTHTERKYQSRSFLSIPIKRENQEGNTGALQVEDHKINIVFYKDFIVMANSVLTLFLGITFPFFGGLLGFFGGFVFAPTSYFLPCVMWLVIYKPRRFSLSWCANWLCIICGVLLMVLAPIGALRQIILESKDYKF